MATVTDRHLYRRFVDGPRQPGDERGDDELGIRLHRCHPPRGCRQNGSGQEVCSAPAVLHGEGDEEDASHCQACELGGLGIGELSDADVEVHGHLLPEDGLDGQVREGCQGDCGDERVVEIFPPFVPVLSRSNMSSEP